uniref:Uncharacterized protein n=1 Tax=Pseudo-nitzschia australis TaxID=44445 RepID=A0A7S4AN22_9STRA|mmetsp:Transcript_9154/g.18155  ORF Transcript_9154/g.18155 Transcript_9154/m.18155 type:complete len:223 (-) Transcript_9154:840-1508(-)
MATEVKQIAPRFRSSRGLGLLGFPSTRSVFLGQDENGHDIFGEEGAEPLLDSFDSYIVVSVLTATASFAALFEANLENNFFRRWPFMHNIWVTTCALCSLSGIYATVVFSLSSTYGRTAVGTGKVHIYETFLKSTSAYRSRAFRMYLWSLRMFVGLLIFTAVDRVEINFRLPFLALLIVLSVLLYRDWATIMKAAVPIFSEEKIQKESKQRQGKTMRQRSRI